MSDTRRTLKSCIVCGGEFVGGWNAKYCEYCKAHPNVTDEPKTKNGRPLTGPRPNSGTAGKPQKSIRDVLAELEAYNREHGTHYTYGQYVGKFYRTPERRAKSDKQREKRNT